MLHFAQYARNRLQAVALAAAAMALAACGQDAAGPEAGPAATPALWRVADADTTVYLFGSIHMLPPLWQKITLFNPEVYLVSGFRWSFYGVADVGVAISLGMTLLFMLLCLGVVAWIFRSGYKLKA